ncbi:MAG: UDP-N-acetylglucosamine 2-epimerase, partial [Phycisphaerales bacterium]|nr:UDP-N-acetylglucosamine 2-epimerase [Phycisphaerales bacterium]
MGKTPSEPRASARAAKQRPPASTKPQSKRLRVAVVTGTRAEFGLLRPVMDAIKARKDLQLLVVAGGAHLLAPARTIREVESAYTVAATVPMQRPGQTGRAADAAALGRGVSGFAKAFADLKPDWVVVLGDRIEALAAGSAASVAGIAVCHIHGGDRAEGIADEAMRHA